MLYAAMFHDFRKKLPFPQVLERFFPFTKHTSVFCCELINPFNSGNDEKPSFANSANLFMNIKSQSVPEPIMLNNEKK